MNRAIYIIGYPGSGKTTAMRLALSHLDSKMIWEPFRHMQHGRNIVQLGFEREMYGGTDGLQFNVQPKVLQWLPTCDSPLIVGEGDRLANSSFLAAVEEQGRKVTVVHLQVGELVALQRIRQRGSNFDPVWVRRTMTKVDNLAEKWSDNVIAIDGTQPKDYVSAALRELFDVN
jgi:thymidylate kinase